jgi:signal peptidase II
VAAVAVGLVVGGAAGNILDRLFRSGDGFLKGEVVDFIDLQWWPVFNVADAAVVIGGILLLVSTALASDAARR